MKKKHIITLVWVFSIVFFGCEKNIPKADIDSNGMKTITLSSIEKSFQDTAFFKDPQLIVLETNEESLLSEISRICTDNEKLFIYDRKLHIIVIFDASGKYLCKIDCKGQGPGEYIQLTDFTIDPIEKQLVLLCAIPKKRMYFTYDGKFVKEERQRDYYSFLTTDSEYIYFEKPDLQKKDFQLHILNTKSGEKKEGLEVIGVKNNLYGNGNSFSRGKDIFYVRRYDNSIYELKDGTISKKYHVDFKKHAFPDWLIEEENSEAIFKECMTNEYIYSMSNIIENDNYLMFYTEAGVFLYDKKHDTLTGYKTIQNSKLNPILEYPFSHYLPVENTNKIAFSIDEPSFIKHIAEEITEHPEEVKKINDIHPKLLEEIIELGNKITDDNNPILFIYEFKN